MTAYDVESFSIKRFNIRTYVPMGLEVEPLDQFYKISETTVRGEFV